jgi:hypothetical protein
MSAPYFEKIMNRKWLFASFAVFASIFINLLMQVGLFKRPLTNHDRFNHCDFVDPHLQGVVDFALYSDSVLILVSNNPYPIPMLHYINQVNAHYDLQLDG